MKIGGRLKKSKSIPSEGGLERGLFATELKTTLATRVGTRYGAGLLTPPKRPTEGLPVHGRPSVGGVARSGDRPQQDISIKSPATSPGG